MYDYIKLCLGYPRENDSSRIVWRKWNGVKVGAYNTNLFGRKKVYAIDVSVGVYNNQHLAPTVFNKRVLTLNLKRLYWEAIHNWDKKEEYREIKPYWTKRLTREKDDWENNI